MAPLPERHGRVVFSVGALLSLVATGTIGLDRGTTGTSVIASATVPGPCQGAGVPVWRHENGDAIDPAAVALLSSNGFVTACAPAAGTVTLTLRGTVAEGVGTRAVLVQGAERLLDLELRDETRTFDAPVPTAGLLVLAFVNDLNAPPEDRNLWVSGLDFTPHSR